MRYSPSINSISWACRKENVTFANWISYSSLLWMRSNDVLKKIQTKINDTLQPKGYKQCSLDMKIVILGVKENEECVRIFLNTILYILKWELWKIRNIIKYEIKTYPNEAIPKTILNTITACRTFWMKTKVADKQINVLDPLQNLKTSL